MGFFDTLLGHDAADAANKAAADTYAKQQTAVTGLQQAGGQYATDMRGLADSNRVDTAPAWAPYQAAGGTALATLLGGLGLSGQGGRDTATAAFQAGPGYQYAVDQALDQTRRAAARDGSLVGGNTLAALSDRAGNMANQEYGSWLSNLSGMAGMGQNATGQATSQALTSAGQYTGTVGQGLTGKLGTDQAAYGGQMSSANTIGQGMVAGANAESGALTNLLNAGAYLGGAALSGGTSLLGGAVKSAGTGMGNMLMGGGSPTGYGR